MTEPAGPSLAEVEVLKCQEGAVQPAREVLAREALLTLCLGGEPRHHLLYLPGQETELVWGFLLTAGYIDRREDVAEMRYYPPGEHPDRREAVMDVRLAAGRRPAEDYSGWLPAALLTQSPEASRSLAAQGAPRPGEPQATPAALLRLMAQLPEQQHIFRQTGATHAILIADPVSEKIILGAEDVGRHNAFDKVIGRALAEEVPLQSTIALLSGRASYEMVLKAARAGIPFLAAVSAPTHLAVRLAVCQGITLAGFVRGARFNVYAHPERLRS